MKTMFLAAAAVLLLFEGLAQAEPTGPYQLRNEPQEASATITRKSQSTAMNQLQLENPTGLPAYELRSDGLLRNGLLPANGWEG